MKARVLAAAKIFGEALAAFNPALLSGADCAELAEALSKTEKACAGARARAAARAVACGAHKGHGFTDGADWLARQAGTSLSEARGDLQAGKALEAMPATLLAVATGEVSLAQATEVARAEAEAPGSEAALLELAKRSGLGPVREEARRLVLEAACPEELYARQHRARSFRHWRDDLGMVRFSGALPPSVGTGIVNRLEAAAARLRRAAGEAGPQEPFEAYAADALAAMLEEEGPGSPATRADLVLVCDLAAYRRGYAHPGESCHIAGGGPVPVCWVREMAKDAFIKAVLHDGVDISTVAHFGRHLKAELRTALELGGPPDFEGLACLEPGCGRRYGLQFDHIEPLASNGPPSYANLQALCCWPHHSQKTERDRKEGRLTPQPP